MVKGELRDPIERRMKKIFKGAIFFECLLYLIVSFTGYFCFMDKTKPLILNRPALPGSNDYLMTIGRIVIFAHLLVSITVLAATCRE